MKFREYLKKVELNEGNVPKIVKLNDYSFKQIMDIIKNSKEPHVKSILDKYSKDIIEGAINHQLKQNLTYNTETGVLRCKEGVLSSYISKKDITKFDSEEEVIEWEFMGEISNSASRKKRGYDY